MFSYSIQLLPKIAPALRAAVITILAAITFLSLPAQAATPENSYDSAGFDMSAQLDALGKDELMQNVPDDARELMEENGLYDLSPEALLGLSPENFFKAVWNMFATRIKAPARTLGTMLGIILLCAFLDGLKTAAWDSRLSGVLGTVSVLCVVLAAVSPILDCVVYTAKAIRDASLFMVSFIPAFSAALAAAGQPVTGAAYNAFLFSACQIISQVASQLLVPLMGIYLALCIAGALLPGLNISSAASTIKTIVSWALGLLFTLFVGLLSIQTMVSAGADGVTTRAAKFVIGNFVPVIGGALSDAYTAAQGCLRFIKTSVGVYGVLVAVFTFLPVLLNAVIWYLVTSAGVIAGDLAGASPVASVLKACANAMGILIAVILCYALLLIVSTTVVMVTGMGTA